MKAAVYAGPAVHQKAHATAMADGLKRHGIEVSLFRTKPDDDADFIATWGWRTGKMHRAAGREVLVMERGYIGDRFAWTSLGWNGLNGRATWADDSDKSSERFDNHFGHLVKHWRTHGNGYALIVGQVPGDMSLDGVNMGAWYLRALEVMRARGYEVKFRAHPEAERRGLLAGGVLADLKLSGSLEDALSGAAVVVTMNSNTGVDAALAGAPTIACDHGAMAWPVVAKGIDAELVTPDRTDWLRRLAWRQFALEEIASGDAWEHIKSGYRTTPRRRALVLGGASCVWADVEAALALGEYDAVIAANDVGAHWTGRLDHWVSLHPDKFDGWVRSRREKGYPDGFTTWAHKKQAGCPVDRETDDWKGSSGLFAAKVARELGFDRIVLCGVPLDAEGAHFFDPKPWSAFKSFRFGWLSHRQEIAPFVRSMSGWTKEILGAPTEGWIAGRE